MKTTRTIAANLAAHIAKTKWVPDGINAPKVYLDAITTALDFGDTPVVIVSPRSAEGVYKNNPLHRVDVVLALDSSGFHSNAAAPAETPEGVTIFGSGDILDDLTEKLVNTIESSRPGGILAELSIEYSYDTLPGQYATISATFRQIGSFGAFGDGN